MERLIISQAELTGQAQNAYSSGRGIFMPDSNARPDVLSHQEARPQIGRRSQHEGNTPSRAEQMQKWKDYLGRENQTPDARRLAEALVNSHVSPEHGSLPIDPVTIKKAETALDGKRLTEIQRRGLTAVHLVGHGEPGRDGTPAKVGNYTDKQVAEKARMLDMLGFTPQEARTLFQKEVVGMQPPTRGGANEFDDQIEALVKDPETNDRTTIMPTSFTDPQLRSIAEKIQNFYDSDYLSDATLQRLFDSVSKHATEDAGANPAEAKRLETAIRKIAEANDQRTGKAAERAQRQRGSGPSEEQTRDNEFKSRIATAQAELDADPNNQTKKDRLVDLKKERREFVKKIAGSINVQSGRADESLFEIIIDEGNSLDYLVDRIISPPLDSETGDWSLGLYGQSNLDMIINFLRTQRETADTEEIRKLRNVQYNSVVEMEKAAELVHAVNKSIINADLKVLSTIAGSVTDEKLTRLSKIKGVGIVARLLEVENGSLLAKDGWINGENYGALFGKVRNPETGLLEKDQQQSAFTSFKQLVDMAKERVRANPNDPSITNEMKELAELDDWQVLSAFNIGKSLYNLWLRGAEWISQGKVPKGDKGYVSFPQESIARILNFPQWMLQRFDISKSRGGVEWLNRALAAHQAIREEQGYGEMGLSMIGGKKIENFEMPDMIGVRGWLASWREKQLVMSTMPLQFTPYGSIRGAVIEREGVPINPNEVTDLGVLLDNGAISIRVGGNEKVELGKASDQIQIDYLKSIFLDQRGNLRGDFQMGLGASLIFLKPHGEWGDKKHGHLNKALDLVKNDIRKKIWEKAAEENPLGLVPFLHGLQYKGARDPISIVPKPSATPAEKQAWRGFERKLFQLNEIKMQRIRGLDKALAGQDPNITRDEAIRRISDISLGRIIGEENGRADGIKFDAIEQNWLDTIKTEGRRAAPHLANVRFEYNPFLNDVPLEKLDYGVIGHEGYRRMLNDTSGFQEANNALISIMDNPSKYKEPGEIFEAIAPFVSGAGGILGTNVGQEKGWIWLDSALSMFERGSNATGLEKRIRQLPLVNEVLKVMHSPNSEAQVWAGPEAGNWDAQLFLKASEEAVHAGVISEEEEKKWRKKYGGRVGNFLIRLMRAVFAGVLVGVVETGKEGVKSEDLKFN